MNACPSCDRHLLHDEAKCPFCGVPTKNIATRVRNAVASGVTMVVLAACYGPAPGPDKDDSGLDDTNALIDADGDGALSDTDCDDNNADVFPGQTEECSDTIDNDCDTLVDAADSDCGA